MFYQEEDQTVKASSRSVRRHHMERLKKNRSTYWGYPRHDEGQEKAMSDRTRGIVANTPKNCGCWMCSRPRKVFAERTMQEQRQMQSRLHDLTACAA
jgi:hypothetical protein